MMLAFCAGRASCVNPQRGGYDCRNVLWFGEVSEAR
jgi:hypothetical protein